EAEFPRAHEEHLTQAVRRAVPARVRGRPLPRRVWLHIGLEERGLWPERVRVAGRLDDHQRFDHIGRQAMLACGSLDLAPVTRAAHGPTFIHFKAIPTMPVNTAE